MPSSTSPTSRRCGLCSPGSIAVDHLFVSAAPGRPGPLRDQDLAAARSFVDGKLLGTWMCARYAAPLMTAGGSMTFITGVAAVRPPGNAAMVTAAFAAVEALAPALALELAPVRVNVIRPGYTDSEMWGDLSQDARDGLRARVSAAMPVRRMGTSRGHRASRSLSHDQPPDHGRRARGQRR